MPVVQIDFSRHGTRSSGSYPEKCSRQVHTGLLPPSTALADLQQVAVWITKEVADFSASVQRWSQELRAT